MPIKFRCEHCGKKVEAPDNAGGRRGRCPYCGQSCYIPAPVAEDEVYELAPEDETELERQRREKAELRAQEEALMAESGQREPLPPTPFEQREDLKPEDLYHVVVNYCLDLADSKLDRAQVHLEQLRKVRRTALAAVDDFLRGKALEPALEKIPAKLLRGFLNQLREALAQ